ncbi:hypothetical protein E2C01_031462 [Portunus trituberculatus]|uniref:Uncharacterized protein n=1 Tax=Portunus trituberculatus TaxID=210409 RepID=A0A5B7EXR4_PORTR|nr:hypothetical protein [Portunus trituberculatus]
MCACKAESLAGRRRRRRRHAFAGPLGCAARQSLSGDGGDVEEGYTFLPRSPPSVFRVIQHLGSSLSGHSHPFILTSPTPVSLGSTQRLHVTPPHVNPPSGRSTFPLLLLPLLHVTPDDKEQTDTALRRLEGSAVAW